MKLQTAELMNLNNVLHVDYRSILVYRGPIPVNYRVACHATGCVARVNVELRLFESFGAGHTLDQRRRSDSPEKHPTITGASRIGTHKPGLYNSVL